MDLKNGSHEATEGFIGHSNVVLLLVVNLLGLHLKVVMDLHENKIITASVIKLHISMPVDSWPHCPPERSKRRTG